MSLRSLIKIFFIFIVFFAAPLDSYPQNGSQMLRVAVKKDIPSFVLRVKGRYIIETLRKKETLKISKKSLPDEKVIPTESGIQIGEEEYKVYAIRIIPTKGANIYVDEKRLRGIIDIIRTKDKKLLIVNHIDVEEYLYGVLYYETPHYWPMEILMAQAIAARTFALYRKEEMKDFDFDLTSDTFSQVYGGKKGERWRTRRAVNLTKGKVLTYEGKIFPAYYHSICAGHTEDASEVWKTDLKPLKGVKCGFCKGARGYDWKSSFSYRQMEERLNGYGIKCKNITYIVEGKRNKSGRLESIRIKDKSGVKNIPANKFRLALGSTLIRSANFTVKVTPKGIIFKGKGWGHGVGMCQWGAFKMAKKGRNHKQILNFYYPATKIKRL